jgi:hypothetical protein
LLTFLWQNVCRFPFEGRDEIRAHRCCHDSRIESVAEFGGSVGAPRRLRHRLRGHAASDPHPIGNGLNHHDRTEGRIAVSVRQVDGVTEFRVSDDGPGIASQFHERIFLMFQTLASRDDIESSGIGLTIVKKKVQSNGGQIWIESAPPVRGTTFVFTWKESVP